MIDADLLNKLYVNKKDQFTKVLNPNPSQIAPVVTQSDAENGYFMRYFICNANDNSYVLEIDKKQYERFKSNPRFTTAQIKWKIIGEKKTRVLQSGANLYGVEDQNRIAVANADLTFGGLRRYITNYLEYWVAEK